MTWGDAILNVAKGPALLLAPSAGKGVKVASDKMRIARAMDELRMFWPASDVAQVQNAIEGKPVVWEVVQKILLKTAPDVRQSIYDEIRRPRVAEVDPVSLASLKASFPGLKGTWVTREQLADRLGAFFADLRTNAAALGGDVGKWILVGALALGVFALVIRGRR